MSPSAPNDVRYVANSMRFRDEIILAVRTATYEGFVVYGPVEINAIRYYNFTPVGDKSPRTRGHERYWVDFLNKPGC